ncbi:MAG: transglutaminase family protein [Candidatus Velthaea sp.]
MEFTILHQTTYRYPTKVHESYMVCHLQPLSDTTQYCTKYEIHVAPHARVFTHVDRFGNQVQNFGVLPEHDVLSITARSSVATVRPAQPEPNPGVTRDALLGDPDFASMYDFLRESAYVAFGPELRAFASLVGSPEDDLDAWFAHAGRAIKAGFTYDKHATSVHTTVDESIRLRGGVCQDFAHILVALCRFHAIPARYVSGYIFSGQESGILGADSSHAWAEAYLPPYGWVGYDPTNDQRISDGFVKIAVGRDYRDVSPVRGVYKGAHGGASSELSVDVAVEALAGQ